jgi:hypothetical protein
VPLLVRRDTVSGRILRGFRHSCSLRTGGRRRRRRAGGRRRRGTLTRGLTLRLNNFALTTFERCLGRTQTLIPRKCEMTEEFRPRFRARGTRPDSLMPHDEPPFLFERIRPLLGDAKHVSCTRLIQDGTRADRGLRSLLLFPPTFLLQVTTTLQVKIGDFVETRQPNKFWK